MIDPEDVPHTYKYSEHKKILSTIHYWSNEHKHINGGTLVMTDFTYCYGNNTDWMSRVTLHGWIEQNREHIGKI